MWNLLTHSLKYAARMQHAYACEEKLQNKMQKLFNRLWRCRKCIVLLKIAITYTEICEDVHIFAYLYIRKFEL